MHDTTDLHIHREILPLFDFTLNDFSKEIVINILKEPLSSVNDILVQQDILKGIIANLNVLKDYSYSRLDLFEVYTFLSNHSNTYATGKGFTVRLLLSEKERHRTRSRCIQVVMLLHRLHTSYLKRIDARFFPERYKNELQSIHDFLSGFELARYEELIREQRFKVKHITELTTIISQKAGNGELKAFWERYFLFEAYLSIGTGIAKHRFSFPLFTGNAFSFEELYHPLVKQPVKNSFAICNNVTLVTGPNMSGKSTVLKALGLCVYLAHLGVGVPASKAEIPFFDAIFVSIHLTDNLSSGYSHFMTEVMNLKKVVLEAMNNKRCFAVFDELFRGTNIEDAVAISSTTVKGLTRFTHSFFFISTHLLQLKEIEEVQNGAISTYYIHCELKNNTPVFTYQLKKGWSDLKIGQILFDKEGLNRMFDPNLL